MSYSHSPFSPLGGARLLGKLLAANMNSTADQAILINSANYRLTKVVVRNVSTSLTLAAGGIYTTTSKGGSAVVAAAQVYSGLTGATKALDLTIAAVGNTDMRTETTLYFSLTTAQGGAATADIYIYGEDYS